MAQLNRKKPAGGEPMAVKQDETAKIDTNIKVNWDETNMKTSYANVCNVASTREEVTLLFGTNQTWQTGQREVTVNLTDRVILNPFAAKRLSMLLGRIVAEYEARFGELDLELNRWRRGPETQ
jgi:hypothetical protein